MSELGKELRALLEDKVPAISAHAEGIAALVEQTIWLDDIKFSSFEHGAADSGTLNYSDGYDDGVKDGYALGFEEGEDVGYRNGLLDGRDN